MTTYPSKGPWKALESIKFEDQHPIDALEGIYNRGIANAIKKGHITMQDGMIQLQSSGQDRVRIIMEKLNIPEEKLALALFIFLQGL